MKQRKILLVILAVGIIITVGCVIYLKPITSDVDEDTYYIEDQYPDTDTDISSETYIPTEK